MIINYGPGQDRREVDVLRRCIFRPYRKGAGPTFTLVMWDCYGTLNDDGNHSRLGYRLTMILDYYGDGEEEPYVRKRVTLFEGEDYGCSPMHSIDGDASVEGLMSFLCLRPGDTDAEYFANYTPQQMEFAEQYAEALHAEVDARFCDENGRVKGGSQ